MIELGDKAWRQMWWSRAPHLERLHEIGNTYYATWAKPPFVLVMGLDFYEGVAIEWTQRCNPGVKDLAGFMIIPDRLPMYGLEVTLVIAAVPEPVAVGMASDELCRGGR